jgi:hydrocephalus-inducing protein
VHHHTLHAFNMSLIPASFKAFVAGKGSVFSVDVREATLAAGEAIAIDITVQLDETYAFSDVLHLLVDDGDELEVPLSATGVGNTLYCADLTGRDTLDFGDQFTSATFSRTLTVENQGRRMMNVLWVNAELERVKHELGKTLRGPGGKTDLSLIPPERRAVFVVQPEKAVILAKQAIEFVVTGFAATAQVHTERVQLLAGTGASVCSPLSHSLVLL